MTRNNLCAVGDGGPLVAAAHGERLVISLELTVVASGGGLCALDEEGAQRLIAPADASRASFSGALVVAGSEPGPGGAVTFRREDGDVGAKLDDDCRCGAMVDAGYGGSAT